MDKLGLSQEDVLSLVRKKGTAGQGITKKPTTKKKAGPLKGRKIAPKYSIKVGKRRINGVVVAVCLSYLKILRAAH